MLLEHKVSLKSRRVLKIMYKRFFNNSVGYNTLAVTLDNDVVLHYQLDDNPVQHQWQRLILDNLSKPILSSFNNKSIETHFNEINTVVERLGETPLTKFDTDELNELHSKFVKQQPASEDWKLINKLIHCIESAQRNDIDLGYFLDFCIDTGQTCPIEDHHKLWLTTTAFNWGVLSLGYNTVGKSWIDVAIDNDTPEEAVTKIHISTETVMCFGIEPLSHKRLENQFWEWAQNHNIEIDLNKLDLGNYLLGKTIITKSMLDYHNQPSDWYVPNHSCKLAWNRDVLSTANFVKDIQFYNSDLAHDTAIEHTKILCLK